MIDIPLLRIKNVSMRYYENTVLKDINLSFKAGSFYALLGSNGSGKSTLVKIISGQIQNYTGDLLLEGRKVRFSNVYDAKKQGIFISSQENIFFNNLTVLENLYLGTHLDNGCIFKSKIRHECKKALELLGLNIPLEKKAAGLSLAEKNLIQLSRLLIDRPRILILDELADSLTLAESEKVNSVLTDLKNEGVSIIYITHRVDDIINLADSVITIRDGVIVSNKPRNEEDDLTLKKNMLGDNYKHYYPKLFVSKKSKLLEVRNVSTNFLSDISFSLCSGEILGIAGLVGSGRSSLLKAVAGLNKIKSGSIDYFLPPGTTIGYLPEDRDSEALFYNLPLEQNISIRNLQKIKKTVFLHLNEEKLYARDIIERLGIDTASGNNVTFLSGGNKQKVIIGRHIFSKSSLYIFDEPTQGIDIAGKVAIYNIFNELIRRGAGILLVSSDFSELAGMCDRLLVINRGSIVGEFNYSETNQDNLFSLCGV